MRPKLTRWPDPLLETSILRVGALVPRLVFEGKIIDGKRRSAICTRHSLPIEELVCESRREAAFALFALEPARAVALFGRTGPITFAALLGVRVGYVARWFRTRGPSGTTHASKVARLRSYVAKCEQGLIAVDPAHLKKVLK